MHYISVLNGITEFDKSKSILEKLGLIVKEYDNLYLVKYDKNKSQMYNEDVMKCRGVILEKNTNKLICISPPKSINTDFYHNKYIKKSSEDVVIEEFYDGTMINMFKYNGESYISTRSCLGAHNKYRSVKTFNKMFSECIDLKLLEKLEDKYCYSFLLQHPDNKIVKEYITPSSILVMTTKLNEDNSVNILDNVETLDLLNKCEVTIKVPKILNISSMDDIYKEIDSLDEREQGLVLKFYENGSDNRSKIRNLKYNEIRKLRGNDTNKMYMYFELRKQQNVVEYLEYFPEDTELFDEFRHKLYGFTQRLFNYYQELKVRKNIRFLEIDYEFRPLINELHTIYKSTNKHITKNIVINYLHNLNSARILFVLNYNRNNPSSAKEEVNQNNKSLNDYPLLNK